MNIKPMIKSALLHAKGARNRLRMGGPKAPRFAGVYGDYSAALAAVPSNVAAGYDDPLIADVSFTQMCRIAPWDYPVLFWLGQMMRDGLAILDAGGHLGTKYIAFGAVLPLKTVRWTVYDLPGIVATARARQHQGDLPAAVMFQDDPTGTGKPDILLASGLLQYLDLPFAEFLRTLPALPPVILLNKVAMRHGAPIVTLELIGANRVPYQIRNRPAFEAEITAAGYEIRDSWAVPELSHEIGTHPWLAHSESRGYLLHKV